jgi:hypothetical protein
VSIRRVEENMKPPRCETWESSESLTR